MDTSNQPTYYLVDAKMLPEIFVKVVQAKELLQTGEASTVGEATAALGISRSAFYKYKDGVAPFKDMKSGRIITYNITLRDKKGVLSLVLSAFADTGANILTINQSIPINGIALVTISTETAEMRVTVEELMTELQFIPGVKRVDIAAG